jgi:hypothetical protein
MMEIAYKIRKYFTNLPPASIKKLYDFLFYL